MLCTILCEGRERRWARDDGRFKGMVVYVALVFARENGQMLLKWTGKRKFERIIPEFCIIDVWSMSEMANKECSIEQCNTLAIRKNNERTRLVRRYENEFFKVEIRHENVRTRVLASCCNMTVNRITSFADVLVCLQCSLGHRLC